jgi:hypothetical protein
MPLARELYLHLIENMLQISVLEYLLVAKSIKGLYLSGIVVTS